jgi:hypothetical protein
LSKWSLQETPGYMLKPFRKVPSETLIKNGVISKAGTINVD